MFNSLNCNTANLKRVTEFDSYGEPTATSETIKCKLEKKYSKVVNRNGDEVISSGTVRTNVTLGYNDMIEVDGIYRPFIVIQPQDSFSGKTMYWIGWF